VVVAVRDEIPEPLPGLAPPGSLVVEEQHFAVVPEWVIDADLSDAAFRLYSLLLRYGNGSGSRMPSRRLLAQRLHRSTDSIDRALRELVVAGIVRVEHRRRGRLNLTNCYHLRTTDPRGAGEGGRSAAATYVGPGTVGGGRGSGRAGAATRTIAATSGSRNSAARVAADVRPDPEKKTQRTPPPPAPSTDRDSAPPGVEEERLAAAGVTDLEALARRCQDARRGLGLPTGRWAGRHLAAAVQLALIRGWPSALVQPALLTVAADPATRSPMRLAEAGPWWDQPPPVGDSPAVDVAELEAELDDVAHLRPALQAQARAELTAEHQPVTRTTVVMRAVQILHRANGDEAA
jgi:hypothetical protein